MKVCNFFAFLLPAEIAPSCWRCQPARRAGGQAQRLNSGLPQRSEGMRQMVSGGQGGAAPNHPLPIEPCCTHYPQALTHGMGNTEFPLPSTSLGDLPTFGKYILIIIGLYSQDAIESSEYSIFQIYLASMASKAPLTMPSLMWRPPGTKICRRGLSGSLT